MPKLTAADEYFYHQFPEPLSNVTNRHPFWRESLFFIMHPREELGDTVILTMATYPHPEKVDAFQLGIIGEQPIYLVHERPYDGDPHTLEVGPTKIDIIEPYKKMRVTADPEISPVGLDVTFTARTRERGLRRGTMKRGDEIIWDQSHMIQSGVYNGSYSFDGKTYEIKDWWGQRDHSWGIRDHARCPMWMWLAIQLPDCMIAVWNWEYASGARVYTDGCLAPTDMSEPVVVTDFTHDLNWLDAEGNVASYGLDGGNIFGLAGDVSFTFANGRKIEIEASGNWAFRYGPMGGGLSRMKVRTSDGVEGTAIYEVTGAHHHRFFPEARAENLPTGL